MGSVAAPLTGHLDVALSNFAKGFRNNALISDFLAPRVGVADQRDKYMILGREGQQLTESQKRAPGAPAQQIRVTLSGDFYFCESHALEASVPDESEAANKAFSMRQAATQVIMDKLLLAKEFELANLLATAANVTNQQTNAGNAQWSDPVNSDPIGDIEVAKLSILKSGAAANTLVISPYVLKALRVHAKIADRFKYTQPGAITTKQLSDVFQVDNVLVANAVIDNGDGTQSFAWGKNVFLVYVSPTPSMMDVSALKTFVWESAPATVGGIGTIVARNPKASAKSDDISTDFYYAQKLTAQEALFAIYNAVA